MRGLAGRGIVVPCFPQIKMFQDLLYDFRLLYKKEYGGIRKEQFLYNRAFEEISIMAMFWPWSDGAHITVKIVRR